MLSTQKIRSERSCDSESFSMKVSHAYKSTFYKRLMSHIAHMIRSMKTKLYQSVSRIQSKFRWCLTGTPIQNTLEDLASLVAFVRSSHLDSFSKFCKTFILPLQGGHPDGEDNLRILLDSVCLRRTQKLLDLHGMSNKDRFSEMSALERKS